MGSLDRKQQVIVSLELYNDMITIRLTLNPYGLVYSSAINRKKNYFVSTQPHKLVNQPFKIRYIKSAPTSNGIVYIIRQSVIAVCGYSPIPSSVH